MYPGWYRSLKTDYQKSEDEERIEEEIFKETKWLHIWGNVAEWITACIEQALLT